MSATIATAVLIQSQNAQKIDCIGLINNYKQTSNVVEMQAYAECVNIVYPDKQLDVYIGKTLLVSAFIFIIIGSMIGYKKHKDSFDMLEGGFAGLFVWVLCFLTLAAIGYLIYA